MGRPSANTLDGRFYYAVLTLEGGQVIKREMREKFGHRHIVGRESREGDSPHGLGPVAQDRHVRMASAMAYCQVLLCQGMGWGAYQSMEEHNITPIITEITDIDAAVQAYLDGTIVDHTEWLH